jgi:hypothetical protein
MDQARRRAMFLKMIPSGLGMSTRTTFGDDGTETAHSLRFTLHLAGHDSLKLETGEVFQNPAYAAVRRTEKNAISAHLSVHPVPDGGDTSYANLMRYHEGTKGDDYGSPPLIHFNVSTPASDYSMLLNNIRGGIMPSSVMVDLRHNLHDKEGPLAYDWAPDGSMMIWRNALKQNRVVAIESIEFRYRLLGEADDDDEDKPPTAKASIDAASVAIVGKLADLEKAFVMGMIWIVTVIIIACAVLYFARH